MYLTVLEKVSYNCCPIQAIIKLYTLYLVVNLLSLKLELFPIFVFL